MELIHDRTMTLHVKRLKCHPHTAQRVKQAEASAAGDHGHPISGKLGRPLSCPGEFGTCPPRVPPMTSMGRIVLDPTVCHKYVVPNLLQSKTLLKLGPWS